MSSFQKIGYLIITLENQKHS